MGIPNCRDRTADGKEASSEYWGRFLTSFGMTINRIFVFCDNLLTFHPNFFTKNNDGLVYRHHPEWNEVE